MILLNSPLHQTLLDAIREAETEGNCHKWNKVLKTPNSSFADGFLAILDYGFPKGVFANSPFHELDEWLLKAEAWRRDILDPAATHDVGSLVLYVLWEQFRSTLIQLLRKSRLNSEIPQSGGLLVFVGGLSKCLIMRYEMVGETATLQAVGIVQDPKSVFDFWGAIDQVDMKTRDELKTILASGHKLVVHRGILVHVDRLRDFDVFGPSIDTLVLAEILSQEIFESKQLRCETAMEIGCGNGLLTAAIASNCESIRELFAIDTSFSAVSCTQRNVFSSGRFITRPQKLSVYLVAGPFRPSLINRRFDLVVCNPPYIPLPPTMMTETSQVADYFQAVGGTSLIQTVLESVHILLRPGGKLLLMASSLSLKETLSLIPNDCKVFTPLGEKGLEVIFDVYAVLKRPEWVQYLRESCGLIQQGNLYFHTLHPIWVELTAG